MLRVTFCAVMSQYVGVLNEYAALGRYPRLSPRFSFEEIRDLCESQLSLF